MMGIQISSNPRDIEAKYSARVSTLPIIVTYSPTLFAKLGDFLARGSEEIVETIKKAGGYGLESLKENVRRKLSSKKIVTRAKKNRSFSHMLFIPPFFFVKKVTDFFFPQVAAKLKYALEDKPPIALAIDVQSMIFVAPANPRSTTCPALILNTGMHPKKKKNKKPDFHHLRKISEFFQNICGVYGVRFCFFLNEFFVNFFNFFFFKVICKSRVISRHVKNSEPRSELRMNIFTIRTSSQLSRSAR